jgi:hypothetical protein
MSLIDDIIKIPRKEKNGMSEGKSVASLYIDSKNMGAVRALAKQHHVAISGIVDIALVRLLADIKAEAENAAK